MARLPFSTADFRIAAAVIVLPKLQGAASIGLRLPDAIDALSISIALIWCGLSSMAFPYFEHSCHLEDVG